MSGLTVVVPAFNEAENIAATLDEILSAARTAPFEVEVIVVNDGSSDETPRMVESLAHRMRGLRLLNNARNMGVGYSVQAGFRAASSSRVVSFPGDNGYPRESVAKIFSKVGTADLVISYITNMHVRTRGRQMLSRIYTVMNNALFGHRLHYYNGPVVYPLSFLNGVGTFSSGFAYQAELLITALHSGLSYVEVGVDMSERVHGKSKAVSVREVAGLARTLWGLFWRLRARSQVIRANDRAAS